ncbi:hypothetical protein Sjap_014941 [Stephania japonica]|uniref:Uncharacterized protein n=1 Tax=Stephania japonica TaxID=461633 RepID=A0AAP0II72_9MAGN
MMQPKDKFMVVVMRSGIEMRSSGKVKVCALADGDGGEACVVRAWGRFDCKIELEIGGLRSRMVFDVPSEFPRPWSFPRQRQEFRSCSEGAALCGVVKGLLTALGAAVTRDWSRTTSRWLTGVPDDPRASPIAMVVFSLVNRLCFLFMGSLLCC